MKPINTSLYRRAGMWWISYLRTCQWHLYEWPSHMSNYKALVTHMTSEQIPEEEGGKKNNLNMNSRTACAEVKSRLSILPFIFQTVLGLSWMKRCTNRSLCKCDITKRLRLQSYFIAWSYKKIQTGFLSSFYAWETKKENNMQPACQETH